MGLGSEPLPESFLEHLSERDLQKNSTLHSLDRIQPQLSQLRTKQDEIRAIADLGCGHGGFAAAVAAYLGAESVYGVDTDPERRQMAEQRNIETFDLDLEDDPLPFSDGEIDLVISFGLIEHLCTSDHLLKESHRVLADDGKLWLSTPNLGSWLNRLALFTGHQPRNVELSSEQAVGTLPWYPDQNAIGHIHAPTYRALRELLAHHSFDVESTACLHPYQRGRLVPLLDRLLGWHPSLSRRVAVLAQRVSN